MNPQEWIAVRRALIAMIKAETPKERRDAAIMLSKACDDPARREALVAMVGLGDAQAGIKAK